MERHHRDEDHRAVSPHGERKSSGSETTFFTDLTAEAEIEAGVLGQADSVWAWCEKAAMHGRTVTTKIKFADFRIVTRSRTLAIPVTDRETLRRVAVELVRTIFPPRTGIRLLGVTLSNFDAAETAVEQMALGF